MNILSFYNETVINCQNNLIQTSNPELKKAQKIWKIEIPMAYTKLRKNPQNRQKLKSKSQVSKWIKSKQLKKKWIKTKNSENPKN